MYIQCSICLLRIGTIKFKTPGLMVPKLLNSVRLHYFDKKAPWAVILTSMFANVLTSTGVTNDTYIDKLVQAKSLIEFFAREVANKVQ